MGVTRFSILRDLVRDCDTTRNSYLRCSIPLESKTFQVHWAGNVASPFVECQWATVTNTASLQSCGGWCNHNSWREWPEKASLEVYSGRNNLFEGVLPPLQIKVYSRGVDDNPLEIPFIQCSALRHTFLMDQDLITNIIIFYSGACGKSSHSYKQILPRKNNKFAINILQHHERMYLTL